MFSTVTSKRRIQGGMNRQRLIQHPQTLGRGWSVWRQELSKSKIMIRTATNSDCSFTFDSHTELL
jgi:hypothetical protein